MHRDALDNNRGRYMIWVVLPIREPPEKTAMISHEIIPPIGSPPFQKVSLRVLYGRGKPRNKMLATMHNINKGGASLVFVVASNVKAV